jgi:hypothetical protein
MNFSHDLLDINPVVIYEGKYLEHHLRFYIFQEYLSFKS